MADPSRIPNRMKRFCGGLALVTAVTAACIAAVGLVATPAWARFAAPPAMPAQSAAPDASPDGADASTGAVNATDPAFEEAVRQALGRMAENATRDLYGLDGALDDVAGVTPIPVAANATATGNTTQGARMELAAPPAAPSVKNPAEEQGVPTGEKTADAQGEASRGNASMEDVMHGAQGDKISTDAGTPTSADNATPDPFFADREATDGPAPAIGWSEYIQALGAVFTVLALVVGGFWALKRFGPGALSGRALGRGGLAMEAQLALGPRRSIAVVRILNKRLVLGVTDSQITLLTEMETDGDELPQDAPPHSPHAPFSQALAKARTRGKG